MLKMVHRYVELKTITSTTGNLSAYYFSANGMFDPNISGVGHQPLYFDQVTPLYNHYCVVSSTAKLTVVPNGGNVAPIACGLQITDSTSALSVDFQTNSEQTMDAHKDTCYYLGKPVTLKRTWNAKDWFGKDPLDNTELQGTSSANPTEQSYFGLWLVAQDTASSVTCYVTMEIEYTAVWKEIKDVASS